MLMSDTDGSAQEADETAEDEKFFFWGRGRTSFLFEH